MDATQTQGSDSQTPEPKPVVLVFLRYYLPGFKAGGALRSVSNIVSSIGDKVDFRIVCLDRDLGDSSPYQGIESKTWIPLGKCSVFYISPGDLSFSLIRKLLISVPYSHLYLNSLFDPWFTTVPLMLHKSIMHRRHTCVIIAPRGELSPGALAIHRTKKQLFLWSARMVRLYRNARWHASTAHEAAEIAASGLAAVASTSSINVASDIVLPPERPTLHSTLPPAPASLRIVFMSRISEKKNLTYALRILRRVSIRAEFDVYGPIESAAYWAECMALANQLPNNVTFRYRGALSHEEVPETLSGYDIFFLPTLGENFGHVFAEALLAGTPILTSDLSPWRNLEISGVGWDLPLDDEDRFVQAIVDTMSKPIAYRQAMSDRCREFARRHLENDDAVPANLNLFT